MTEATTLVFTCLFCIGSTVIGFMLGWFANAYYVTHHQTEEYIHPEFLDSNGNYLHEELLSVRFVDEDELEDD